MNARPGPVSPAPADDALTAYVGERVAFRRSEHVALGPVTMRLRSNLVESPIFDHFPSAAAPAGPADFELCCIETDRPGEISSETVRGWADRTYRGQRFQAGYYITDHFGAPLVLATRGARFYVFGPALENVVWPYFVKLVLTLYSVRQGYLHLKAASCAVEGGALLVCGRGGAGKTVFLAELCRGGADFVSNTHVLVRHGTVYGMATAVRVRDDGYFKDLLHRRPVSGGLKPHEFMVRPEDLVGSQVARCAPLRAVFIVEHRADGVGATIALSSDVAYAYLEQFALAINVYGLKEDLFDALDQQVDVFVRAYEGMKTELRRLVTGTRCFRFAGDIRRPADARRVLAALHDGRRAPETP